MKEFERKYSGDKSKKFWKRVNALPDDLQREVYAIGVDLQNYEHSKLDEINALLKKAKKNSSIRQIAPTTAHK